MENILNSFSNIDSQNIAQAANNYGTPVYVYDETAILQRCKEALEMPNAYGLTVRYAMKANSNRSVLKTISAAGLHIDASSLNEVMRAHMAEIPYNNIMLTTQEIYEGADRLIFEEMLRSGLSYSVCSLRQLGIILDMESAEQYEIGIRIHPGVGSGESITRNTGDEYACFGVHLMDIEEAVNLASQRGVLFKYVHVHIGSGGDPLVWQQNIDNELSIIKKYFPHAETVNFGGGLKVARMPDEKAADINELGQYAKMRIEEFFADTGRKLKMEIEPGTYIMANSGYAVTRVIDKKRTALLDFVIIDGSMEINSRPLLYGSRHPIYIIAADGSHVKSSDWGDIPGDFEAVVAGRCCESGDCQTLDSEGKPIPRSMVEPDIGDIAVIGGTGAYCSAMTPFNYNSHTQIAELMLTSQGTLEIIRRRQTLAQMLENEV